MNKRSNLCIGFQVQDSFYIFYFSQFNENGTGRKKTNPRHRKELIRPTTTLTVFIQ